MAALAAVIGLFLAASSTPASETASLERSAAAAGAVAMATVTPVLAAVRGAPPPEMAQHIRDAASAYVIDVHLLEAVAWKESRFKQGAESHKGAAGVMQLMPGTAREIGVDRGDARQNIFGGAAYLKDMLVRFGGDVDLALAAYNAGPGAVQRYGGVPPYAETQDYVTSITARAAELAAMSGETRPST
jgi:soluble lytic murein transglycosylase-like protein